MRHFALFEFLKVCEKVPDVISKGVIVFLRRLRCRIEFVNLLVGIDTFFLQMIEL
jgi:hypothetical protein